MKTIEKARTPREGRSLKPLVGAKVYGVWVDMLRHLVPDGRSHRLSPLVAGMLRYASDVAWQKFRGKPPAGSGVESLLLALDGEEEDADTGRLAEVVERLFKDARVRSKRMNRRGDEYSLVESSIAEFIRWHQMPWE